MTSLEWLKRSSRGFLGLHGHPGSRRRFPRHALLGQGGAGAKETEQALAGMPARPGGRHQVLRCHCQEHQGGRKERGPAKTCEKAIHRTLQASHAKDPHKFPFVGLPRWQEGDVNQGDALQYLCFNLFVLLGIIHMHRRWIDPRPNFARQSDSFVGYRDFLGDSRS